MEIREILRFLSALIFVVSLMGGLWLILKRMGINGGFTLQQGKKRRMAVIEILPISVKHKAVLFRCDDKEHLVILGPNSETVVQNSIQIVEEKNDA